MQKNFSDPSDRTLRQFAAIWILFFGAIALRQQFQHHRTAVALIVGFAAVSIGAMGLARPRWIKPVFVGWMKAAYPIGWLVSRIVLSVIFYGVFTPVALMLRLFGRDALSLEAKPSASTYWHSKPTGSDNARYLRQY